MDTGKTANSGAGKIDHSRRAYKYGSASSGSRDGVRVGALIDHASVYVPRDQRISDSADRAVATAIASQSRERLDAPGAYCFASMP